MRQEKLRPLLEQYWALLDSFEAAEGTALSKAKSYSLNQKEALNAVLLDGRLELTNNLCRAHREAFRDGPQELSVLRYSQRGRRQRPLLQRDGNGQAQRAESLWLSVVPAAGTAQIGRKSS